MLATIIADTATHATARAEAMMLWLKLGGAGALVVAVVVGIIFGLRRLRRKPPCVACGMYTTGNMYEVVRNGARAKLCASCYRELDKRVSSHAIDRFTAPRH